MANIIEGIPPTESARKAGYEMTGRMARTPRKLIETPELRARMQRELRKHNGSLGEVARTVVEAMSANQVASFQGVTTESDIPDHKVRVQAASKVAELWGLDAKSSSEQAGSTVTLTLSGAVAERMASMFGVPEAE